MAYVTKNIRTNSAPYLSIRIFVCMPGISVYFCLGSLVSGLIIEMSPHGHVREPKTKTENVVYQIYLLYF